MARVYGLYLQLLRKWPLDPSKKSRDLGQYIRDQIKINFVAPDNISVRPEDECIKTYEILKRIADNHHKKLYDRLSNSSATGLTADQCKAVLSDDFLEFLKEDNKGFISQVFSRK